MARTQNRLREAHLPGQAKAPAFRIVREGEPVPEIAHRPLPKPKQKRARSRGSVPLFETEPHCPLCDGLITRFDAAAYLAHGRCAPCQEALTEEV